MDYLILEPVVLTLGNRFRSDFLLEEEEENSTKQCDLQLIGSSPCGDMDLWEQTGGSQFHRVVCEEFRESFIVH